MATNSNIEWTEATWNPIAGCTPVSSGCLHCYAATMAHRLDRMGQAKYAGLTVLRNGVRTFNGKINLDESALSIPFSRRKPTMYFVNSMSDLFHKDVPFEFIDKVFAVMALCPQHTFQVLTKRPERMAEYLDSIEHHEGDLSGMDGGYRIGSAAGCLLDGTWIWGPGKRYRKRIDNFISDTHNESGDDGDPDIDPECFYEPKPVPWPLPNVWLGTSVENQKAADERIPHLLKCPAAVRFLSCEPLLGPVDLCIPVGCSGCNHPGNVVHRNTCTTCGGSGQEPSIDWIIVGGESGPGARPCEVEWIRYVVNQCADIGKACFVKQLGANVRSVNTDAVPFRCFLNDKKGGDIAEFPADLRVREFPEVRSALSGLAGRGKQ